MIRPLNNACRSAIDLSGIWCIRFDPDDAGRRDHWGDGIGGADSHAIAIPGSWNEQLAEAGYMSYVGAAWLETRFFVPEVEAHRTLTLRFGSADYHAEVWVNGIYAGASGAAMLPFEIDIDGLVEAGREALLVVRVTNVLPEDGPTQGITKATYAEERRPRDEYLPAVRFDFFPYGGINRPVHLVRKPKQVIASYHAQTSLGGVSLTVTSAHGARVVARLSGHGEDIQQIASIEQSNATLSLLPGNPQLWSPDKPILYTLEIRLEDESGALLDCVTQKIGLREIRVEGSQLLLNGQPIELRGFGKHEDSPIHGRGLNLPQMIKDFGLLKWIGANSVRTSHYPYAEEFLDMADEAGILVIDEVFSINLDFRKVNDNTLYNHKQAVSELIARDINRTCVIAWSLSNEPGYLAEPEYRERSGPYWKELFDHARTLDTSRPMTHANVGYAGNDDPAFDEADIVTINRYHGWYSEPGQLAKARVALEADFNSLAAHGKPIFVAEFGADAMAGQHATYDQMFTEEYQARFIETYWEAISAHPSVIGGHVWNFADFRTAQHGRRVVHNLKGVFTRTREPKMSAWRLRELWARS
jgi:beta-glucuronidase